MSVQLDAELRDALGNLNHETSTTNWYIAGYRDTRDTLSLYAKGTGHLKEFREFVEIMGGEEPVLYGFVRTEAGSGTWALLTVLSERVGAVDRARAMVHARAVVKLYELPSLNVTASDQLTEEHLTTQLSRTPPLRGASINSPGRLTVATDAADAGHSITPVLVETPADIVVDDDFGSVYSDYTDEAEPSPRDPPSPSTRTFPPRTSTAKPSRLSIVQTPTTALDDLIESMVPPSPMDNTHRVDDAAETKNKADDAAETKNKADDAAETKNKANDNDVVTQPPPPPVDTDALGTASADRNSRQLSPMATAQSGHLSLYRSDIHSWKLYEYAIEGQSLVLRSAVLSSARPIYTIPMQSIQRMQPAKEELCVANSLRIEFAADSAQWEKMKGEPMYVYVESREKVADLMNAILNSCLVL